jgi:F0F1-type ATP synthase assembly protein I
LALVFEFTGTVAAGAFVGYLVDEKLGTEPWLLIGFTLAAVALGFVRLVKIVRRFDASRG